MTPTDDPKVPEPTDAAAMLVNSRGQYLLHLRDANKPIWQAGKWALPGGGREAGEALEETIARELREEAGLVIPNLRPFTIVESPRYDSPDLARIQIYVGSWEGDAASLPLTEGVMLHWFDPDVMPRLAMCPSTEQVISAHRATATTPDSADPGGNAAPGSAGRSARLNVIGVHLYLEQQGKILLGLRHPDSAYAGGTWHFLAGHCEEESAVQCLVREAREEAGLIIDPGDVELVHAVHMVDEPGGQPRLGLVFRARLWEGSPQVLEPDRCVRWDWWSPDALPEPIVPYTRAAVDGIRKGHLYTEMGWPCAQHPARG